LGPNDANGTYNLQIEITSQPTISTCGNGQTVSQN